ncbi:hydroxyisourate hydrolase [Cellulomonas marina]|uniref:5-hydroxyisourate hydrolase n=1 Tax=Cellulomonas marina TaxID=988821 RepID=A0A1I0ZS04_9CELL|nr:hydroxyisourate hydrolase [Cellulomonas marina]GIG28878.1 5-hydroxyisourate hydrolase [Cellulomonas marina]SFB27220.1 5-hydroxyisourate hydrolase [Cellulomonas marina]
MTGTVRSHVTTHVLDGSRGRPAVGVTVRLTAPDGTVVATAVTDADGRVGELGPPALAPGTWSLTFETGAYYAALAVDTFYPAVTVAFTVPATEEVPALDAPGPARTAHLHVPLLLSPYAYSTYRGS